MQSFITHRTDVTHTVIPLVLFGVDFTCPRLETLKTTWQNSPKSLYLCHSVSVHGQTTPTLEPPDSRSRNSRSPPWPDPHVCWNVVVPEKKLHSSLSVLVLQAHNCLRRCFPAQLTASLQISSVHFVRSFKCQRQNVPPARCNLPLLSSVVLLSMLQLQVPVTW